MTTVRYTCCYDNPAKAAMKLAHQKLVRAVTKLVPEFQLQSHFNAGGIAVWGETYVKIYRDGKPVVEAILSKDHSYIRQWDGKGSGRNITLKNNKPETLVELIRGQAAEPFRRF